MDETAITPEEPAKPSEVPAEVPTDSPTLPADGKWWSSPPFESVPETSTH